MLEELWTRQSIRRYEDKAVEDEKLEELLRAAMHAPTARNTQSWRFMIIRNRQALDEMTKLQPYTGMMKTAPCAILVMGDRNATDLEEYLYCDCSAAIENILIEARHQGLSTCWCAVGPKTERIDNFRRYYRLEEHLLPVAVVAVGYGCETKEIIDRFDPKKITYYD